MSDTEQGSLGAVPNLSRLGQPVSEPGTWGMAQPCRGYQAEPTSTGLLRVSPGGCWPSQARVPPPPETTKWPLFPAPCGGHSHSWLHR